ncbi:hypothetical protein AB0K52_07865 [Glycomyces sp. NPDC049804]|uniref:hypothetical protein n=1 Tax=Glycomyces sp. NPDC049804 TaxID=3154363 RepID=UPI0034320307
MHPTRTRRTAVRTALVVLTAVLAVFAAAAPASAGAPIGFATEALGEDYCTLYSTAGEAEWAEIGVEPTVNVTGKAWTSFHRDGRICLGVEPHDRHLEVVAYDKDAPVDVEYVPMPERDNGIEYAFALTADETASIDYLTVAVCRTEPVTGTQPPHCDGKIVIAPPA